VAALAIEADYQALARCMSLIFPLLLSPFFLHYALDFVFFLKA
jgi:hypothetical protein